MQKDTHKDILVHCCCGPCSTVCLERLISNGFKPVLYYGNSNIFPEKENTVRWNNLFKVASYFNLDGEGAVYRGEYNHGAWLSFIHGYEDEPEGGKRCMKCFEYNLRETAAKAQELGIEAFTTTLTVSRYKNSMQIFSVGEKLPGFEKIDFKKQNGYARSIEMSRQLGLYRQKYCGCEFSVRSAVPEEQ